MVNRVPRTEIKKKFAKSNFRLPQTATVLAQQYNVKPKTTFQRWRWQVFLLSMLAVVFILTYSGIFKIRNIIVENVASPSTAITIKSLLNNILSQRRLFVLPQNNLAIFSSGAARKVLRDELNITKVNFDKHWPNVLRVKVEEDIVVGVVKIGSDYYTIDKRGVAINQLTDISQEPNATIIQSRDLITASVGEQILDPELGAFMQGLSKKWRELSNLPKISNLEYITPELPKVNIVTNAGWLVYVSAREDISKQLESLQAILSEILLDQQSNIQYIDVRFGSKLYYKLKDQ